MEESLWRAIKHTATDSISGSP